MARILHALAPEDPEQKAKQDFNTDTLEQVLAVLDGLPYTVRMAMEHVLILGETGCGKSTGSFAFFLTKYFAAGFGALLNCITEGCLGRYEYFAALAGRGNSMIVVEPSRDSDEPPAWRCNIVNYIVKKAIKSGHANAAERVVEFFSKMAESRDRRERSKGANAGDVFFTSAAKELVRNATQVAVASDKSVSFGLIDDIINSVPRKPEQVYDPAWQKSSLCYQLIESVDTSKLSRRNLADFERSARYLLNRFPQMPPDTSGSIIASYGVNADVLRRGHNVELFDSDTNFIPEMSFEAGALICLNMPPRRDGDAAGDLQAGLTYIWQMAAHERKINAQTRPVVWASDEAHVIINDQTSAFLADARNCRVACLLATQNISNLMAAVGGENGRNQMESLLGNTATKVFHTNAHHPTNKWASEMIAQKVNLRLSFHGNMEKAGGGGGGAAEHIEPKVLESKFTELQKGGPRANFLSEAILFRTGERFANTEDTYTRVQFRQVIPGLKWN